MLTDPYSTHTGGGTLVPSNPQISDALGCDPYNDTSNYMNGHFCPRHDLGVLEYESRAADFNLRIMWPVNLTR